MSFTIATLAVLPLAFVGALLITWSIINLMTVVAAGSSPSATQIVILLCAFCLPLWTTFAFLDGKAVPRRSFRYSLLRYALSLNVGSLHEWFLTNKRVARYRAERAAADTTEETMSERVLQGAFAAYGGARSEQSVPLTAAV